ncbi:3-hydroxybutyrate oligomer hydrolase family protein [Noviherbaspirillum sp. Root189]|uniref:3-hydroxybutyrate oligomer hydrolase family protein n=1 Tax=Noviherbaspirillum sp. Root189 TaxID=1736487 RepID=UPI00070CF946|nr:3-hydroxybutyrate oligomer hydrolase family protein [Noviherbaspirillum sp. Root189]KRB84538.1 cytochrome C1 [Noviherbaspirillum sp. Root189]
MATRTTLGLTSVIAAGLLAGCGGSDDPPEDLNLKPSYLGTIQKATYDGVSNDLLTAGLGRTGLQAAAPAFADPANPTIAELRRNAIHSNYRALIDPSTNGGFGTLYGPNIDNAGNATLGEGKIAGDEYIAYADDGTGQVNVTLMVQIPAGFDKANPCIVTATSSGSRGVYGAIGTAGDWGLKQNCAVAYSDKGSGMGFHNLQSNTVNMLNGERANAVAAGKNSSFTANLTAAELTAFNAATPNRFAIKQAHSQQNSEKDWGKYTLQAVEFAFYALNDKFGDVARNGTSRLNTITPAKTLVIASSASNGGGAAILAAEQDTKGLIDGVAVSEPVTEVALSPALTIKRGNTTVSRAGLGLYDTITIGNLYQPCAALSSSLTASPLLAAVSPTLAANRCAALKAKNLLTSTTLAAQADESLQKLREAGFESEADLLHASHFGTYQILAPFYANMYGKFSVKDNLCGYSFAPVTATGALTTLTATQEAQLFATANGTPSGGLGLVNNNSVGGPIADSFSVSPSTNVADYNIDGAICLRNLATGTDVTTGQPLTGQALINSQRVRAGMAEVLRNGNLRGKPAIIVHGRNDALIPVNHNSRAYFTANKAAEGAASKLSYIEITNANHFDAFLGFPGYDTRLIPIHRYHIQAMNMMYAHLKAGAALPPSQVVRTVPRGGTAGAAPAITAANVPPIQAAPIAANQITFANNTTTIPE